MHMQAKQQKQTCGKRASGGRVGRARWVVQAPSVAMDNAQPRALYPWWKGETIPVRTRQVARQGSILHPRSFCTHETFTAARAGWHSAAARSWRPGLRDGSGNRRPRPPAFCPECVKDGGVGVYWSRQPCAPTIQHPLSGPKEEHAPARSRRPSLCRDAVSTRAPAAPVRPAPPSHPACAQPATNRCECATNRCECARGQCLRAVSHPMRYGQAVSSDGIGLGAGIWIGGGGGLGLGVAVGGGVEGGGAQDGRLLRRRHERSSCT